MLQTGAKTAHDVQCCWLLVDTVKDAACSRMTALCEVGLHAAALCKQAKEP